LYWDERVAYLEMTLYGDKRAVNFGFELTLYWDERVVFLHFDLVLRQEGRKFWIVVTLYCDERVVILHFDLVLTWEGRKFWIEPSLYWDERVVVLHFDLVLRREGRKFWINLWIMLLRLYTRVVKRRDTTLSPFSNNNIFYWFAWSLIFLVEICVRCMTMHDFPFYLFFLKNAFTNAWIVIF